MNPSFNLPKVWDVEAWTYDNINFRMTNLSHNGQQSANTVYNGGGFNVDYPPTFPMPYITSILLNGESVCSG